MGIPKIFDGFDTNNGNSEFAFTVLVSKKVGIPNFILRFLEFQFFKDKIQASEFPIFQLKICLSFFRGCL